MNSIFDMQKIDWFTQRPMDYFPMEDIVFFDCIGRQFLQLLSDLGIEADSDLLTKEFIESVLNDNKDSSRVKKLLLYKEPVNNICHAMELYKAMSFANIPPD